MDNDELKQIKFYILYPYSRFRTGWDVIMIIFVIYNLMVLPMNVGLGLKFSVFRSLLEIFVDVFFACDIVLNFFTGYIDEHSKLIMD